MVLLTARAGTESIIEGLALGADDYLVKPFAPTELLARVRVHVELHRRRESTLADEQDRSNNLEVAVTTNRQIGTAVGILMAEHKINSDEAFELLTTASHTRRRKLRDIAAEVAATGALPRLTRRMSHAGAQLRAHRAGPRAARARHRMSSRRRDGQPGGAPDRAGGPTGRVAGVRAVRARVGAFGRGRHVHHPRPQEDDEQRDQQRGPPPDTDQHELRRQRVVGAARQRRCRSGTASGRSRCRSPRPRRSRPGSSPP